MLRLADPKRSKYRSRATGGYASAKEARRAQELKLLEKAGKIRNLREQVTYILIPEQRDAQGQRVRPAKYVADFVYEQPQFGGAWVKPEGAKSYPAAWDQVVEDCKGYRTPEYRLKAKLMLRVHGVTIFET